MKGFWFGPLVVVLVAVAVGACADDPDDNIAGPTPSPTSQLSLETVPEPPEDVFSFETDDLCEWVPEDQLAAVVSANEGSDSVVNVTRDHAPFATEGSPRGCAWLLTDLDADRSEGTVVVVVDPGQSQIDELNADVDRDGTIEYEPGQVGLELVTAYPGVREGVVVQYMLFSQFAVGVPSTGQWLYIAFLPAEGTGQPPGDGPEAVASNLAVADYIVEALGWLPAQ